MKKAVIIAGGDAVKEETIKYYTKEACLTICCDSGALMADKAGIVPDIVMGDFDSSDYSLFGDSVKKIKFPPEKDFTDTHLALRYAIDNGFCDITIIGGLGGRLDHSLANISILTEAFSKNAKVSVVTDTNRVTCVTKDMPFKITKDEASGSYVSLLPLGAMACGVCAKGFKYELENHTLCGFDPLGVSNEVTKDVAEVTVTDGILFVIISEKK